MAGILLEVQRLKERCRIVLASSSPRRHEILSLLGVPFEVVTPKFAEDLDKSKYTPPEYVMANARIKCAEVVMKLAHPRYPQPEYDDKVLIVIGADTVVVRGDTILEKPEDAAHALAMLKQLQGREHQVITGMAVSVGGSEEPVAIFEETSVSFAQLTDEELKGYIETGEPFDKAGAYGIQALGSLLVTGIRGNYQNVVGLPLAPLSRLIAAELARHLKGAAQEQMSSPSEPRLGSLEATLNQLRQEVAMRDQEINMLVGSLSKRGNNAKEAARAGPVFIPGAPSGSNPPEVATSRGPEALSSPGEDSAAVGDPTALLLDRNKAFDAFRRSVRRSETLDDGREAMKQLVVEAKEVGELANAARASVQVIQKKIEKARLGRVLGTGPHDPTSKENAVPPDTPEIATLNHTMEVKISTYKKSMERLKWVKAEIEKYRSAAEENKERLQRDFEAWYLSLQAHQASVAGAEAVRPASAQSPAAVVESSPRSNSAQESRKAPGAHEGVLAASGVPQEPPATSLTGHQQTDDDIRAYFAAVANLESR
ncbi:unnamed protein product [Durusdinium trenchii]|uniref:Kinesin-like protein KIF6/9 C-terminal domain-containing protein n=1 Tax=Durusdinium trenchii TaxID=1381693 RepID=A0ABP0P177_9DINO